MSTDRELLKMAAKACGISVLSFSGDCPLNPFPGRLQMFWNPLNEDGDALRLAVHLHIDVCFGANYVIARGGTQMPIVNNADDPNAATRRAIVIEAAGIGRAMP